MSFSSSTSSNLTELTGSAKLEEVTRLMNVLALDLQKISLLPHQRDLLLEQLKVFGRDPANADPIFTKEGIEVLTRHAFDSPSVTTSHKALRCLANAMLLKADTRQMFIDLGYEPKACNKLKNDNRDDEFLVSRVIFLTTYGSNVDIEKLIDQHHLAENICVNIGRHAEAVATKQKKVKELDPMEDMALIESLKLLFNITSFCPQRSTAFSPALPSILVILQKRPISSSKPLDPPIGPLINSLINIPLEAKDSASGLFPKDVPFINVDRFLEILGKGTEAYTLDEDLKQLVSPLVTLIWKVYQIAPEDVQRHMRNAVLPSDEDRKQVLGRANSLSSHLLRLMTNVSTPSLHESISSLFFEMSGQDARTFVQNVGYGFASGFLLRKKIPMPETALEAWSVSDSEGSEASAGNRISQESGKSKEIREPIIRRGDVNPITGQRREFENIVEELEMTQEEKEREAEKLFVLFERLNKTGVMSVKNPVQTALQEGRFTELDDDDESE